jgi:uncharacterized protein (DUF1501 family)
MPSTPTRSYGFSAPVDTDATTAHHTPVHRRQLLQVLAGTASAWAAPALWAQASPSARSAANPRADSGRLVVVFLRGAYDGLSALVPYADPHYARLRPTIALPAPDGSAQSSIKLDNTFALHPALAPLLPLWQQGVLAAVPAAGSPDPTRSHFDAQHHWETGIPGKSSSAPGWLNALAGVRHVQALGVGEANPLILAGDTPAQLVPRGKAATRQGALGRERTRDAVMKLYAGDDEVSQAFRAGAQSRMQTAQTLTDAMDMADLDSQEMAAANNGAGAARGLLLDAQHLGTLMRQNRALRIGFVSAGGWDTHANQGAATGALANNLGDLAQALVQLRKDFSQPNDVVVLCSEFGRTSAENGTRGTDHGHGNAMWLMGQAVNGGRWHGQWSGLAPQALHEGRDLPVHHDFRSVFARVLQATQGVSRADVAQLFPGYTEDNALHTLMKTT